MLTRCAAAVVAPSLHTTDYSRVLLVAVAAAAQQWTTCSSGLSAASVYWWYVAAQQRPYNSSGCTSNGHSCTS
eukprot:16539-Heterococcus_DN1.PRE.1